jgi:glycerol-3-phosphate dehydrogenase
VEERDYILEALQDLFPTIPIGAGQIVYAYAGIRPLPVSNADFTGRISRGHAVRRLHGAVPQIGMVGGKWTTYRAFAEETVDAVLADLGKTRQSSTRDLPIGGGAGFTDHLAADLAASHALSPDRAGYLADIYGSHASKVAEFCPADDRPLPGVAMTEGEVRWAVRHEHALHLADVLQRRSPLAIRGMLSLPVITTTARVMGAELDWSEDRIQAEITSFISDLATWHGVTLPHPEGVEP